MSKVVCVQSGLEDIREGLVSLGYEVVDLEERNHIDVFVYEANGNDISYYDSMTNSYRKDSNSKGALLINATGKTLEDIDYMINNRVYSPIFD